MKLTGNTYSTMLIVSIYSYNLWIHKSLYIECSIYIVCLGAFPKGAQITISKRQAASGKRQAASGKRQAASGKRQAASGKRQAASGKRQAASGKRQAASGKRQAAMQMISQQTYIQIAYLHENEVFKKLEETTKKNKTIAP